MRTVMQNVCQDMRPMCIIYVQCCRICKLYVSHVDYVRHMRTVVHDMCQDIRAMYHMRVICVICKLCYKMRDRICRLT